MTGQSDQNFSMEWLWCLPLLAALVPPTSSFILDSPDIRHQDCQPLLHLHAGPQTVRLQGTQPVKLRKPVDR